MSKWAWASVVSAQPRALVDLVLNAFHPAANLRLAPAMAHGARVGDVQQRALQVVVGELHPALGAIRHVAIGAGDVAIGVDARAIDLVVGMPDLDHPGLADRVGPIGEIGLVEVLLHLLGRGALVPGEGQVVVLALEVIFDVALGTDQRAHLLVRNLVDVLALPLERLAQGRPGDPQPHRVRLVAVEAADRVRDLRLQVVELAGVELRRPQRRPSAAARPGSCTSSRWPASSR